MRFEFSATDANAMMGLMDLALDEIERIHDSGTLGLYTDAIMFNVKRLFKKVKAYGLKAFDNREQYRETLKGYQERFLEYDGWKVKKNG